VTGQSLKQELHNKNIQVIKLKDQLESRVKKILELKAELARERDNDAKKRKHQMIK